MNTAPLVAIQTAAFVLVGAGTLRRARTGAPVVRAILAGGLAAGAWMHFVAIAESGPLGSPDQPLAFNLFWTSLAALDPLGALLLNVRPRAGILLTVAIMIADVSLNALASGHQGVFSTASWRLWAQLAYGLFAVMVAPRVWAAGASGGASTTSDWRSGAG